jgi:NDP-sugar pyrophosphorylase family protein
MINVLQLAAGKGSRFKDYTDIPKPFIPVDGVPMFQRAYESLGLSGVRYHLLCQESHAQEYNPEQYLDMTLHTINHYTDGAATSAYRVIAYSPFKHEPWLIIDCDFIIVGKINLPDTSGIMVEKKSWDTKSSYSYIGDDCRIKCVAEKQPISEYRNTGQYLFETGELFCRAYEFYKEHNILSQGEFYIAPLYNYVVNYGDVFPINIDRYIPIGTPADLELYNETKNTDI